MIALITVSCSLLQLICDLCLDIAALKNNWKRRMGHEEISMPVGTAITIVAVVTSSISIYSYCKYMIPIVNIV